MSGRKRSVPTGPTPVESLTHDDKRVNIPTADAREFLDPEASKPAQLRYPRDPSLDPQLVWKGKDEQDGEDLVVDAPPIYIQEKIDPRVLIENLRRTGERPADEPELTLFDGFDGLTDYETVEFYQHPANWSNRMILGDSLQVMASLAEKENLRGQVQMIYLDPPYGIKYESNWQASTRLRDVRDGKREHTTREVEQVRAFRDTWRLGVNSYLSYMRDRLTLARDLLAESGSVFVQIGDQNAHLVRSLLDEVFGSDGFVSQIAYIKTWGAGSFSGATNSLAGVTDYLIWYAKNVDQMKYRQLYQLREANSSSAERYNRLQTTDGRRIPVSRASSAELEAGRPFRFTLLTSQTTRSGQTTVFPIEVEGREVSPASGGWKTNRPGMARLQVAGRVGLEGRNAAYVRFADDFPAFPLTNSWPDIGGVQSRADPKIYVVQTSSRAIERCLLMTTDPGDLVIDPTCGSGTTAVVAEQWGRRWITIDTSRVALALARQRIMGSKLPSYLLTDSPEGRVKEQQVTGQPQPNGPTNRDVRKGFVYERVPHVTLKSIANNPDIKKGMSREEIDAVISRHAETELLYDRPYADNKKVRVAGRFTVESLSPHRAVSLDIEQPESEKAAERDPATAPFEQTIIDNLTKAGVQNGRKAERLEFESLVPYAGTLIQAEGIQRDTDLRVGVSIGPQYGTVGIDWMKDVVHEAVRGGGFQMLLVLAFSFDPQAISWAEEAKRLPILPVRMNADLAMGESLLKKTGTGNLFMAFGAPDVHIQKAPDGQLTVEIFGVDVYNPTTGEIRSDSTDGIAMWMIDTDYNEEAFFVRHCSFTGGNDPYARLKRALKADIDEDAWASIYSTKSRPFARPDTGKIAVKVINHYGDEVLKVYEV